MHDWPQIHERYGPLVWQTIYRILGNHTEALDCFQDVFAEVLERSSSRSVRDWPAFLRWIAVRRALDRLRKHRAVVKRAAFDADVATSSAASAGPDAQALRFLPTPARELYLRVEAAGSMADPGPSLNKGFDS
jgi:RNA polymerase sigma factor (sigma-70 family)